jgi:glycine dehydrogenase subunit 1
MLSRIGVASVDELFASIPEANRLGRPLALEPALDEVRLEKHLIGLSDANDAARALSFLGGGMYDHHVPPAMDQLLMRSEFYTAYTPYQPEVSQGTLQSIFEFQTIVCQILGTDVANASMYDGASATAEAVLMARRITGRERVVMSEALHPEYRSVVATYLSGLVGPEVVTVKAGPDGRTDYEALSEATTDGTSAVVVGYPNFFGCVEDLVRVREIASRHDALVITATQEPYALSLIKPPGAYDVDIAVGEGQAMAVPPQLGGPGVGLFSCKQKYVRQLPGRLVGETVDASGARGYVLTLSTREQHIRRARATSNICTNHGLIALALAIRTSMLGRRGFEQVGRICLSRAEYLKAQIAALPDFEIPFSAPTFNELVVRRKNGQAAPLLASLAAQGILAGIDLGRFYPERKSDLLLAVTEKHEKSDLDRLVTALGNA